VVMEMRKWANQAVRSWLIDNFLPTVLCGRFELHRHMWGNRNVRKILRLSKIGPLTLRMQYPMANQIKEPSLKQLVQLLQISIKVNRKLRPPMASMPVTPASVISAITAPTEKTHPVEIISQS
jgi:hypothetical protein